MIDKNALDEEEDSTLNNIMIPGSNQMFITQLIDTFIKDVTNMKNTIVLKMESVKSLLREVEFEEKAAEKAKEAAAQSSLDVLVKLDECKKALRHAEETNDMLARKLWENNAVLATKMEAFHLRSAHLWDDGDSCYQLLNEMCRSLKMRLGSALTKKELASKEKQENEVFAQTALASEQIRMEKVIQRSMDLKQEAMKISELLEFLIDGDQVLDKLNEEMCDKCEDVNQLKEELDQGSPLEIPISRDHEIINSMKKVGRKKKFHRSQKFVIKKMKIKGLQVQSKRTATAAADDDDIEIVTLRILLILMIVISVWLLKLDCNISTT